MAKLLEDSLTINFSKLVKNTEDQGSIITGELIANIEAIIQELVGDSVIVEIQ